MDELTVGDRVTHFRDNRVGTLVEIEQDRFAGDTVYHVVWVDGGPAIPYVFGLRKVEPAYRKSDYRAVPDVWGDERGDLVPRILPAEDVKAGDLFVFQNDHGHAYTVNSVDRVPMPHGPELIRYNCTGGATAGSYQGHTVTILTRGE